MNLIIILSKPVCDKGISVLEPVFVGERLDLVLPIGVDVVLDEFLEGQLLLVDDVLLMRGDSALLRFRLVIDAAGALLGLLLQLDDGGVGLFGVANHDDVTVECARLHVQGLLDAVGDQLLLEFATQRIVSSHLIREILQHV